MAENKPLAGLDRTAPHEHERTDIPIRGFVYFVIGFVVIAFVIHVALWALFGAFVTPKTTEPPSPLMVREVIPPNPQLQGIRPHRNPPRLDMVDYLQRENALLSTYGWVDQDHGVARIPIQRAMRLLVERGLPSTQPAQSQPQASGS